MTLYVYRTALFYALTACYAFVQLYYFSQDYLDNALAYMVIVTPMSYVVGVRSISYVAGANPITRVLESADHNTA